MLMTWRTIPFVRYTINHPEDGDICEIFKKIFWSINFSLLKTFKGQKYKKFAILFSIIDGKNESVFEIMCHEVEFIANFVNFVDGNYSVEEVEPVFEGAKGKFSKLIYKMPIGKYIAATIVYDEQIGEITLGEEPLHMDVMTTSWLLFHLAGMFSCKIIVDKDGLIVDNYNLRKLVFYNMDTGELDFSKIKINVDNYEEWDYYYPEYDREIEENKRKYKEMIEAELPEKLFEYKELKLPKNEEEFLETIDEMITDFKNVVENKAYQLLWDKDGTQRDEKLCQILFDFYAKNYCKSVGIDLTREVETGRGPVDFRFSSSVHFLAHLELKKENNSKLVHGLSKQLPTYMNSEEVRFGFFIIFDFGTKDISKLKENMEEQRIQLERDKGITLRIIYIDAKPKLSASKI